MAKQLFIYEKPVPLTARQHGDLCVRGGEDWRFAASINACPLMAGEFTLAARAFPIVFTRSPEGEVLPVAIMGLRNGENAFVGEDGAWLGGFTPAFLKQYPFVLAAGEGTRLTLCIDETYAGCNREGRGERLFDADGQRTAYLETMFALTQQVHQQFRATQAFGARLDGLGLLQPMRAAFRAEDDRTEHLGGFHAVDRAKLGGLDGGVVAELHREGVLEAIHAHLFSMGAFANVSERLRHMSRDGSGGAAEAGAAEGTA